MDLPGARHEALQGILPALIKGGVVCSQDYHIAEVKQLLDIQETWTSLGKFQPAITDRYRNMVILLFNE